MNTRLRNIKKYDPATYHRIHVLMQDTGLHPFVDIGKPETLRACPKSRCDELEMVDF